MSRFKKIFIVAAVFFIAIAALWLYSSRKPDVTNGGVLDPSAIAGRFRALEIRKEGLTDEQKTEYNDLFLTARNQLDEAVQSIQREGESVLPLLYWPLIGLGNIYRDTGNLDTAEEAYLIAHEVAPDAFVPLSNLGDLYFRYLNDYKRAEEYYLQAVVFTDLGEVYAETFYQELYELYRFHLKDTSKAEDILIQGVKQYPQAYGILTTLARYYLDTGDLDNARSRYHELLVKKPDSEVAKKALAELGQ
ncbi:MAG: tetratricopeptide repeat protein [Patescibacteria group bacterium]